jgi:hypothetical protein
MEEIEEINRATMGAHLKILKNRHIEKGARNLKGPSHTGPRNLVRKEMDDRSALEKDVSVGGPVDSGDAVDQGRFSCSIGSDQAQNLTLLDRQINPLECGETAKHPAHVLYRQNHSFFHGLLDRSLSNGVGFRICIFRNGYPGSVFITTSMEFKMWSDIAFLALATCPWIM